MPFWTCIAVNKNMDQSMHTKSQILLIFSSSLGNYRTQLYDKQSESYLPATPGLGMFVEVKDPDEKVRCYPTNQWAGMHNESPYFRSLNLAVFFPPFRWSCLVSMDQKAGLPSPHTHLENTRSVCIPIPPSFLSLLVECLWVKPWFLWSKILMGHVHNFKTMKL